VSVLTIGRVFDTYDVDVVDATFSTTVRITGDAYLNHLPLADRAKAAAAMRDRIAQLVTADETTVPVTWTEDPAVDGYYRPLSAECQFTAASLNDGVLTWSVELEPVGAGALPQHEVSATYAHVTNSLGASLATINTAAVLLMNACPDDSYDAWNGYTAAAGQDRTAETGVLATWDLTPSSGAAIPLTALHRFSCVPSVAYVGACSIRGTYAGLADQLCLGTMNPAAEGLTISNGLVRARIVSGALRIEVWDSGAWVATTVTDWVITGTAGAGSILNVDAAPVAIVVRNTPEAATVRLLAGPSTTATALGRTWLDIGVQRGSRVVNFAARSDVAATWDVRASLPLAGTSINGGARETANDANGNRLVIVAAGDTRNLVQLGVSNTVASKVFNFGIGVELNGSTATGNDQAQKVAYEFFIGRSETQRVVRR
jgi:hypothetical protein